MSCSKYTLWCTTSPPKSPKSGYSFFKVLKQCGQAVTIVFAPTPLSVSIFPFAIISKRYSLPPRRATSPVHVSSSPRIAHLTPEMLSSCAIERAMTFDLASIAGAQPTHIRTSGSGTSFTVGTSKPSVQESRSSGGKPQGLPVISKFWKVAISGSGNSPFSCTR